MADDRLPGAPEVFVRIVDTKFGGCLDREPSGDVARQRVMGSGLIGDEIEALAPASKLGDDLGRVPLQTDR